MRESAISSRCCVADVTAGETLALEFGHFETAEVPLQSPFSRHFVAHFVGTERVRVKCSITKNCRFTAKH